MSTVEFFFDTSSPWTYLAFTRIEDVCERAGAELVWKPILVGGIFNAINQGVYEQRANAPKEKAAWFLKDLRDWARFYGVELRFPPSVFPVNSVKSLRGALVAGEHGCLPRYVERIFRAYFGEDRDISREEVLASIVDGVGLDRDEFFEKIARQDYKDRIRANTEECMRRGGFGSPTMFVGDDMYFGNDRLVLLEHRLHDG